MTIFDLDFEKEYAAAFVDYPPKLDHKPPSGKVFIDGTSYRNEISYINESSNWEKVNVSLRNILVKDPNNSSIYKMVIACYAIKSILSGEQLIAHYGEQRSKTLGFTEIDLHLKDKMYKMGKAILSVIN